MGRVIYIYCLRWLFGICCELEVGRISQYRLCQTLLSTTLHVVIMVNGMAEASFKDIPEIFEV